MSNFWVQFFHAFRKIYLSVYAKKLHKNMICFLKLIMTFKQELSPENGRYTPLLCFHLDLILITDNWSVALSILFFIILIWNSTIRITSVWSRVISSWLLWTFVLCCMQKRMIYYHMLLSTVALLHTNLSLVCLQIYCLLVTLLINFLIVLF